MDKVILKKLNQVYEDFKSNRKEKLCELKSFQFISNNIPNYYNQNIQRYYLLRYMLGYFCEYYYIYKKIINSNFLNNDYKVLSIGCGCGLDFWGLKMAKKECNKDLNIQYTGIDRVNWLYRDNCSESKVNFINKNIREINILDNNDYNIIIFPKSIGEFNDETFNNLKKIIENTQFTENKLVLVSSLRSSRENIDKDKMIEVINIFKEKHKYNTQHNPGECSNILKENGCPYRTYEIIDNFRYPANIEAYVIKLYTECQGYKENKGCHESCKDVLGRWPITTTSQVKYQIINLKRK